MTPNTLIHGIEFRYGLYELDAPARSAIKRLWPTIEPHLDKAVDDILNATGRTPYIAAIIKQHRAMIKTLEIEHLKALLSGELGERYFESCRRTVEQEATIGFDARLRSTAGNFVLRATIDALAHKHRFSPRKLAEGAKLISKVIAFDVANAMTLHREAAEAAALKRLHEIDAAISEFAGAIGDVLKATTTHRPR